MRTAKTIFCKALQYAGYGLLACGLPLTVGMQAQNYSSSKTSYNFLDGAQYNPQYNYPNGQYQNNRGRNQYNQPGPPRYTGEGWDRHFVFEAGGGVTTPAGDTQNYANTGWNALLGAGFQFNDRLSLLAEWNFNRLGVPHSLAFQQAKVPDGNEHIWTLDLNPKFNILHGDRFNGYVIGGGGFSRALTSFTFPVYVPCGYYYYYYGGGCVGDVTVAHTSTNQGNVDIGIGAEWRASPYERGKLFLEARYQKLFSPHSALPPGGDAGLIPITLGYRW